MFISLFVDAAKVAKTAGKTDEVEQRATQLLEVINRITEEEPQLKNLKGRMAVIKNIISN